MESRLSIIQYSNRKISAEQIQSVVTRIFNEIMSKFADVNGENTVQSEFYSIKFFLMALILRLLILIY